MYKSIRKDIKRIVALLLAAVMVIPINVTVFAAGTWEGNDSEYTHLTVKKSAYYREDGITPIDSPSDETLRTFGYYLSKYKYFGNRNYTDSGGGTWTDYSYIKNDYFLYAKDDSFQPIKGTPLTTLEIGGTEPNGETYPFLSNVGNWTELRYFSTVTNLTIRGVNNIEAIQFPTGIKKLTIENCKFADSFGEYDSVTNTYTPGALNLSSYTDLEEIVIKGTTFPENHKSISGLEELKKLKKIQIDGSDIKEVILFGSNNESGNVESAGLEISVKNCTKLETVNTGKYMLINSPDFSGCTELTDLTVKGIADKPNQTVNGESQPGQTLNINGCKDLSKVSICYKFTNKDYRLLVTATNVNSAGASAENVSFSRTGDSQNGLFTLKAVKDSFLDKYRTNKNSSVFDSGSTSTSGSAKYIVFKQDFDKYNKSDIKIWSDASKIRSYEANPIILRVGETIEDNTPYFLADDGTSLQDKYPTSNYTVTILQGKQYTDTNDGNKVKREKGQIPTADELIANGFKKADGTVDESAYNVIECDNTQGKLKVTALHPGVAYLEVKTSGDGSVSAEQKIIVVDEIASMTIKDRDVNHEGTYDGAYIDKENRVNTHTFKATYTLKYPSLSKYIIVTPQWELYKKGSDGNYGSTPISPTSDGIKILVSPETEDSSSGEVKSDYSVIIYSDAVGGEYSIRGKVCIGKKYDNSNDDSNWITSPSTNNCLFTVQNFTAGGSELAFQPFTLDGYNGFMKTTVDFSATKLTGKYSDDKPQIIGNVDDCLVIEKDPSISGKYTLKFNPTKSKAAIAKFLYDKGQNCYVDVVTHLGDTKATAKTYKKRVYLASMFTVSYNSQGGSTTNNITKYYIPSSYGSPYEYNFKGNLNLEPATKTGQEFMGWYDDPSGGNKITKIASSDQSLGDLTLYAHWSTQHTITYNLDGGTNNAANPATFGEESDDIILLDPSKSGYTFLGWTSEDVLTPQKNVVIPTNTKKDMTFTANWKQNPVDDNTDTSSSSDSGSSSQISITIPTTVPTYTPPEKTVVFETTRVNLNGTSTTVALHADGTVQESTSVPAAAVAGMNTIINPTSPTVVTDVDVVVDKTDAKYNAKIEKVTTVVEAKTINGNISISPQMVTNLKSVVTNLVGAKASKTIDIKINTTDSDGKPLSFVVSSDNLKKKNTLIIYARDPITGGYIMLNGISSAKYDGKTGLTTQGLVSGLEYLAVSAKEGKRIEDEIYNSIKASDSFAKPVQAAPGSAIYMNQAISPKFLLSNASRIEYSVSGNKAIIDPNTGLLIINGNATKGTITVSIKVYLTNGRTKIIKVKIKI